MSSRYYFTTRSPGGVDFQSVTRATWDQTQVGSFHGRRYWTWLLSTSKTDGGKIIIFPAELFDVPPDPIPTLPFKMMFARWITGPLQAQTFGGTFDILVALMSAASGYQTKTRIYLYVTVGDTDAVRGVLLDYTDSTSQWAAPGTMKFVRFPTPQALAAIVAQAGDRVVMEIGGVEEATIGAGTAASNFKLSMYRGTTNTPSSGGTPYADAVFGDVLFDQRAQWVEFSQTILEQSPVAAPANDACADREVVPAVPATIIVPDTSTANDTTSGVNLLRSVWYSFTPSVTGDYGIHTLGSNYGTVIDVYTGSCGALTPKSPVYGSSPGEQWVQTSQSEITFNATAGVELFIRISSTFNLSNFTARDSGGYLKAYIYRVQTPTKGDLIISAQHIVAIRDGEIINISSSFFGDTPAGGLVDDTHRPIPDGGNGYVDHVADRFVNVLFPFELIQFYDLATLDRNSVEVSFIDMNDAGVPNFSHPSAIIMDAAGNLIVSFYGDNYSRTNHAPSDPATGWIRKFAGDVTINDAPDPEFELLGEYEVEFETGGSDFVDLSVDQKTLFYTSAGERILRFDMDAVAQLPDFATVPIDLSDPRPGLRGLRLLPPGDGTGGLLVAAGRSVFRLDADGNVIREYTPSDTSVADLDKIELSPDGESYFYVTDQLSTQLFKFNIATGVEMSVVPLDLPPGQVSGFTLNGGYRAGRPTISTLPPPSGPPPTTLPPPTEPPTDCCVTPTGPKPPPPPNIPPPEVPPFEEECGFGGLMGNGNLVVFAEDWRVA